eukprot:9476825-Pyramimonas_sp.AAC.1
MMTRILASALNARGSLTAGAKCSTRAQSTWRQGEYLVDLLSFRPRGIPRQNAASLRTGPECNEGSKSKISEFSIRSLCAR